MKLSTCFVPVIALLILALVTPVIIHAQIEDDRSATIRSAILADPRAEGLSDEDIESMVAVITEEAVVQGITSEDIVWRPQEDVETISPLCGKLPVLFCMLNQAFGFDGSDLTIPIGLGTSSALLLFLIGSILLHKHGHHPIAGRISTPISN
ncbi:MAG: hypothetical protein AAB947_01175 [Patescibacteria group bacterium]